jgi:hypothetical protein
VGSRSSGETEALHLPEAQELARLREAYVALGVKSEPVVAHALTFAAFDKLAG